MYLVGHYLQLKWTEISPVCSRCPFQHHVLRGAETTGSVVSCLHTHQPTRILRVFAVKEKIVVCVIVHAKLCFTIDK